MDYQKTVNLPQTAFAMKAGLAQKEPLILEKWVKEGLWTRIREKSKGKPQYTLHDGPPYANGNIHIGHALNKILKDMIVKMKTMQGFDSWYVPGWDCHGLPIEHQLLKEQKKRKSDVDGPQFRKDAHAYAMKYVGIQRDQFKRLGVFGDWDNPYLTLAPEYEYWILDSLARLTREEYVYRGLKPVNWCFDCETALAEAEVEYENHTSPSVYVKFKVNNPEKAWGHQFSKPVYLLVWTTTPWTLLANVAVAVHPNYEYMVVELSGEYLVIESSLRDRVLGKAGASGKNYAGISGKALQELTYVHPFGLKDNCRVITVDYVTKEDGTGLVHTAPGHGQEDFAAGVQHKLDVLMPVDSRGVFTKDAGSFAGQHVFKANENIIADLKARGILFASENISHSYPHCWRCKKPVIFRATKQWFLKVDHNGLREKLQDIIKNQVRWIPDAGMERILGMIAGRPDWCLSRQRHWGVPIPSLICKSCGEESLFPDVIEKFAEIVKKEGSGAWFDPHFKAEILKVVQKCPHCGKNDFDTARDILDVWFDSGVSHRAVLSPMMGQNPPAQMYLEGSDQHRGWFQSSLIPAAAMDGRAPYREVLTHGFVVDGEGRKMSKSLGNVISPLDVMKNSGAEILRLWVASSNYNDDIRLSKEILDRLIDAYRKIRNTFRYLLGNLYDYDPERDEVPHARLLDIDKWALNRLNLALSTVQRAYNGYEFAKAYKGIYAFCNDDLSSFYLDILKDRLYTSSAQSLERRSAQTVLYHIVNYLLRVSAPILTFTSEEIFEVMPKDRGLRAVASVHLLEWLAGRGEWADPQIEEKFGLLLELRPHVMKALDDKRRAGDIGGSLEAKVVLTSASERDYGYLKALEKDLAAVFIVSRVEIRKAGTVEAGTGDAFPKTHIEIGAADGEKCGRCWKYRTDVGKDQEHAGLCGECAEVVRRIPAQDTVKG